LAVFTVSFAMGSGMLKIKLWVSSKVLAKWKKVTKSTFGQWVSFHVAF